MSTTGLSFESPDLHLQPDLEYPSPSDVVPTSPSTLLIEQPSIQAYAKLEFGETGVAYYVQTLSVTLGRKALADSPIPDIHLGNFKAISRKHATVQYSFQRGGFELLVSGRNGCFVNDEHHVQGSCIPLIHRTRVQIGDNIFTFILPPGTVSPEGGFHEMESDEENDESLEEGADDSSSSLSSAPDRPGSASPTVSASPPPLYRKKSSNSLPKKKMRLRSPEGEKRSSKLKSKLNPSPSKSAKHLKKKTSRSISTKKEKTSPPPPVDVDSLEKPPIPYAILIVQSLLSTPSRRLTLQGIYKWIRDHHAYFKHKNGWLSSVRHNLHGNNAFKMYPPEEQDDGTAADDEGDESEGDEDASQKGVVVSNNGKKRKPLWGINPLYVDMIGDKGPSEKDAQSVVDGIRGRKKGDKESNVKREQKEKKDPKLKRKKEDRASASTAVVPIAIASPTNMQIDDKVYLTQGSPVRTSTASQSPLPNGTATTTSSQQPPPHQSPTPQQPNKFSALSTTDQQNLINALRSTLVSQMQQNRAPQSQSQPQHVTSGQTQQGPSVKKQKLEGGAVATLADTLSGLIRNGGIQLAQQKPPNMNGNKGQQLTRPLPYAMPGLAKSQNEGNGNGMSQEQAKGVKREMED